jgi:hypothetical protein
LGEGDVRRPICTDPAPEKGWIPVFSAISGASYRVLADVRFFSLSFAGWPRANLMSAWRNAWAKRKGSNGQ